jgi:hypothetical protein
MAVQTHAQTAVVDKITKPCCANLVLSPAAGTACSKLTNPVLTNELPT